ncbi:MAG: neutral/alkaline non-lysosomal ceramidase N-terminal domain-containing protein, partial [Planctomycetia bacterium]|nr:neutral/alkaline non-lysosomal ceramidase N-terminal domain-containing protein [Planctomycetia bacterium]
MMNLLKCLFWTLLGLLLISPVCEAAETDPLEIGTAQADITPPVPFRMAGYFSERPSTGTSDPLYAKAMAFRQGSNTAVFVICDLISIGTVHSDPIRKNISEQTGIPKSAIVVAVTHSHTGPLYYGALHDHLHEKAIREKGKDPLEILDYSKLLISQATQAAVDAFKNLKPASLAVGKAHVEDLSFNRRFHMRGPGPVVFNPGFNNKNLLRPAGPVDPEVCCALFSDLKTGKPIASFTNFALHLDTTGGTLYSADYPFYLSEVLKEKYGKSFFSLFGTGTCGDINHLDFAGNRPRLKAPAIGERLGKIVADSFDKNKGLSAPDLAVLEKTALWPRQQFTEQEMKEAKSKMDEVFDQKGPFLERVKHTKIHMLSTREKEIMLDIQVVQIAKDFAVVALPGEVFVDLGLAIKKGSPFKNTMVIELSQTSVAYVPTKKAFAEGSYETINSFLQPGGGEKMVELALEALFELKDKHKR